VASASARNFRVMLLYRITQHSPLYWPYMFLFVTSVRGLSASDFGLLKSLYYFAVMIAELPLGVVADRLGRKTTLVLGGFANAAGCLVYALGGSFTAFAVGEICFALCSALTSGAESALLYDGYAAEGREQEFVRATASLEAIGLAGATASFVLAGWVVGTGGDAAPNYLATAGLAVVGAFGGFAFVEPKRAPELRLSAHVAESVRELFATRGLLATLTYGALVYAGLRASNALVWNPVLERAAFPLGLFGALTALVTLLGAATAWRGQAIQRALGPTRLGVAIAGWVVAMYVGLALAPGALAVPLIATQDLPLGVAPVLIADLLNRRIESSERRATLLSFESLINRGLYGTIVWLAASGIDRQGLDAVLLGFAGLAALAVAFVPRVTAR
jgi:MFS family permease